VSLALVTLSAEGLATLRRLRGAFPEASLHVHRSVPAPEAEPFARMAELFADLWTRRRGLVVLAPTGAIVRALAPLASSKLTDPAVVAGDVLGRWAISLLSGHEGGANALALAVANALDAEPVVTTTTEAARDLVVGVGCRRGTAAGVLERAVQEALARAGQPLARVRLLASADLKAREPGLAEAARNLGLPLRLVGSARIRASGRDYTPSAAAERQVGLPGVAEPAALLAGCRTRLLLPRTVLHGCTVAIAREAAWPEEP
jgi:cobalt-precorrin 5A hydrolase